MTLLDHVVEREGVQRWIRRLSSVHFRYMPIGRMNYTFQHHINGLVASRYTAFDASETLFRRLQIQTIAGCNYRCPFCPANTTSKLYGGVPLGMRPRMTEQTFDCILEELHELDYQGEVLLHLFNEPLLDERIEDFVRRVREQCPGAYIRIDSNGSLLTRRRLADLVDNGLDRLTIDDYTDNHRILKRIRSWQLSARELSVVHGISRSMTENVDPARLYLYNRAGNVPGLDVPDHPLPLFCSLPFRHCYVGFRGEVVLCCSDWRFEEVLGMIGEDSLRNIWMSERFEQIRAMLIGQNREGGICQRCDFAGILVM